MQERPIFREHDEVLHAARHGLSGRASAEAQEILPSFLSLLHAEDKHNSTRRS